MAKNIKRNYFYNLSFQILTLITPFITTPYIARVLSPHSIGLVSFATSLSQTFGLFAAFGIFTYGLREISYYQDDRKKRTQIFWEVQILAAFNYFLWISLYVIFIFFYIKHDYALFLVATLNMTPFYCLFLFYAMEDFGLMTARQVIFKIIDIIFIFVFVKKESDVVLYVFGSLFFMNFLHCALMWLDVKKYIDWPDWKNLKPFRNFKVITSLFLPTVSVQLYSFLDKLMLGFITGASVENGYYELALRIAKMPLLIVSSLATVVIPRIAYLYKSNERETLEAYLYRSFKFAWFTSVPLCFGLIAISDNFVVWFFGASYSKVSDLLKISSFLLILIGLTNVSGNEYMIPTGKQNKYTFTLILGIIINFALNLFLIPQFFSYGALAASILGELSILIAQLFTLRKEFSIKKIISFGFPYLTAGFTMLLVLRIFSSNLPKNILGTAALIFAGAVIYFTVLLIFRDEFFLYYSQRVLNFIKRFI